MLLFRKIYPYFVSASCFIFVCSSFADDNTQNNIQTAETTAMQGFIDAAKPNDPYFMNIILIDVNNEYTNETTLEDNLITQVSINSSTGIDVSLTDSSISHIKVTNLKINMTGLPLYDSYSPTINMEADISPDCSSITHHKFNVVETNPGLDHFFEQHLYLHGDVFFTTFIQSSFLKNYCKTN